MSYFTTYPINNHVYQIKDAMGVLTTLVIGEKKAMLIDTGYGIADLKSYIQSITTLPLVVVNSHGHMDHTGGNYQFDEILIHPDDIPLCKKHNSLLWRKRVTENAKAMNLIQEDFSLDHFLKQKEGNLIPLSPNTCFDLGALHVSTILMEGHTQGSLGFLIQEDQILVVSDATCPFVWLFLPESTTVHTYIQMLDRILLLPFTYILVGHGNGKLLPRTKVEDFQLVASHIDLTKAVKVTFHNFEDNNSYCYTTGKMYNQNDVGIVFDPNKIA